MTNAELSNYTDEGRAQLRPDRQQREEPHDLLRDKRQRRQHKKQINVIGRNGRIGPSCGFKID